MTRSSRFFRTLLFTCWLPPLLVIAAVCFQALKISSKPSSYLTVGKLIVDNQLERDQKNDEQVQKLLVIVGSEDLKHKARERVHVLHPELKEIPVEIVCSTSKTAAFVNIAAVGVEAKYTRHFLDALLDESILAYTKDNQGYRVSVMERPFPAVEETPQLWISLITSVLMGGAAGIFLILLISTLVMLLSRPSPSQETAGAPPPLI